MIIRAEPGYELLYANTRTPIIAWSIVKGIVIPITPLTLLLELNSEYALLYPDGHVTGYRDHIEDVIDPPYYEDIQSWLNYRKRREAA